MKRKIETSIFDIGVIPFSRIVNNIPFYHFTFNIIIIRFKIIVSGYSFVDFNKDNNNNNLLYFSDFSIPFLRFINNIYLAIFYLFIFFFHFILRPYQTFSRMKNSIPHHLVSRKISGIQIRNSDEQLMSLNALNDRVIIIWLCCRFFSFRGK